MVSKLKAGLEGYLLFYLFIYVSSHTLESEQSDKFYHSHGVVLIKIEIQK